MSSLFQFLSVVMMCGTLLVGGFMVALSLPHSRLRDCCVYVCGWALAALSVIYAVVPDPIPFGDDVFVLAGGLYSAYEAWQAGRRQSKAA